MNTRWVLGGVSVALGVWAAVIYWPKGAEQTDRAPPTSSVADSEAPAEAPSPPPASAAVEAPSAASSGSSEPESETGAATLAQRLESNRLLKEARAASGARQFELYEDALTANPNNEDALQELGRLRLDDEDYEEAEKLAKRCLKLDKHNQGCRSTLEWRYTRTGDFESAAKLYDGCLEETFVKPGCLSFQAGAALRDGDIPRAKELHGRLAALQPKGIDTIVLEASIAQQSGDEDGARAAYRRGCDHGNEFACTWLAKRPAQ